MKGGYLNLIRLAPQAKPSDNIPPEAIRSMKAVQNCPSSLTLIEVSLLVNFSLIAQRSMGSPYFWPRK